MVNLPHFSHSTPPANLAVCGRFHYHHYVRHLSASGALNRFYHSSRVSVGDGVLGLPPGRAVNLFPKEYLVHLHTRLLGNRLRIPAFVLYHELWQLGVMLRWKPAPILHHLLHGNTRRLIARAHADGALVVGEPVNSHPAELRELLNAEHESLGIKAGIQEHLLDRRLIADARNCDYLVAGSNVIKRSFVRSGFPAEKIRVLPYGTDTSQFAPLSKEERGARLSGLPEVAFRAICVGQVTPRKGHVYLLEAWKRLGLPDAELLFVGRVDPLMKTVLARYEGIFRHVAHVPHSLLRHYYGSSDVFVLPSIEDGFGYVCTEALGCGLPVLTTDNTGASELVEDGRDGFIVPVRDPGALADRLERLHGDTELRRDMSAFALQKATEQLQWSDYAAALSGFYRDIVSTSGSKHVG